MMRPRAGIAVKLPRPVNDPDVRQNLEYLLSRMAVQQSSAGIGGGIADAELPAGVTHNLALTDVAWLRAIADAAGSTLTGFTGGTDGRLLRIINSGFGLLTLAHQTGSSPGNRIQTFTGYDAVLPPGAAIALLYDAAAGFWRQVSAALQADTIGLGAVSGAVSVNFALAQIYTLTLAGNVTLSITGVEAGKSYFLVMTQGAGAFTVDWNGAVKWPGGVAFVPSTTAGAVDVVTLLALDLGGAINLYGIGQKGFA